MDTKGSTQELTNLIKESQEEKVKYELELKTIEGSIEQLRNSAQTRNKKPTQEDINKMIELCEQKAGKVRQIKTLKGIVTTGVTRIENVKNLTNKRRLVNALAIVNRKFAKMSIVTSKDEDVLSKNDDIDVDITEYNSTYDSFVENEEPAYRDEALRMFEQREESTTRSEQQDQEVTGVSTPLIQMKKAPLSSDEPSKKQEEEEERKINQIET